MRRPLTWLALGVFGGGVLIVLQMPLPRTLIGLVVSPAPERLAQPVADLAPGALEPTFGARQKDGGPHRGVDFYAPTGTPVRASCRSLVVAKGGHSVRLLGPGGSLHVYADIVPAAELRLGRTVERGQLLGVVGRPWGVEAEAPPHLHYGLFTLLGRGIDPYPLLADPDPAPVPEPPP